ncbi:hypothetical protein E4U52_004834 [Claviceps spartinae]|nr:hypothetical protein E4U52_004834 [Claviceps spartinae]
MTTIRHAFLLYEQATEECVWFQGKSWADFDTLHQSAHEFRVVDRSDEHNREFQCAERLSETGNAAMPAATGEYELESSTLSNKLFAEVSNDRDEQGAWSQWSHDGGRNSTPIIP